MSVMQCFTLKERNFKTSVKIECYFIRPRTMNVFYLIQALALGIFNYFCVCTYVFLITLMLVNMFVFNVNVLINSCNVLYICK
jgi:hypothetical protein